jgi:hypothetical protein
VIEVGGVVPAAVVFAAPGEPVALRSLAAEAPVLFLFYLLDWSGT